MHGALSPGATLVKPDAPWRELGRLNLAVWWRRQVADWERSAPYASINEQKPGYREFRKPCGRHFLSVLDVDACLQHRRDGNRRSGHCFAFSGRRNFSTAKLSRFCWRTTRFS